MRYILIYSSIYLKNYLAANYMKKFYFKVIIGVISLGLVFFIDPSFLSDINMLLACLALFLLPVIFFNGKRLNIWIITYVVLGISIFYTKITAFSFDPDSCGEILCGADDRPLVFLLIYIGILILLAIWQLVSFINKRNLERNKKSPVPTVM
jgi:hypothetical protein